jgi:hypothetical protein
MNSSTRPGPPRNELNITILYRAPKKGKEEFTNTLNYYVYHPYIRAFYMPEIQVAPTRFQVSGVRCQE